AVTRRFAGQQATARPFCLRPRRLALISDGCCRRRKHSAKGQGDSSSGPTTYVISFRVCFIPISASSPSTRRPSALCGWPWRTTCKTHPGRRAHSRRSGDSHSRRDGGGTRGSSSPASCSSAVTRRLGDEEEGDEKGKGRAQVVLDDPMCVDADARSWRRRCRIMAGVSLVTCVPFIILLAVSCPGGLFQFALRMSMFSAARSTSSPTALLL
ncbi:hypothetical protein B0H14DRAFT_2983494, partial [Mycena olivaceomarginata]